MGFLWDWGLQAGLQGGLKDVLQVLPWSLDARPCGDGQVEMVPKRICVDAGISTTIFAVC